MNTEASTSGAREGRSPRPGWFGRPVMSLMVALTWLLLQGSVAPAQCITAVVLGLVLPRLASGFLGPRRRIKRPGLALRLVFVVLLDILRANIAVAKLVLSPSRTPRPAWLVVNTELHDGDALVLLAAIITMTPGTVSCVVAQDVAGEPGRILVHALDADDPQAVIDEIRERYEAPLKAIFE